MTTDPVLDPSSLPYGLPDFAAIGDELLEPAIRAGMDDQRAEIAAIAAHPDAPTVENTSIALERAGQALSRALMVFYGLLGPDATDARLEIERRISPLLSRHHSAIMLDEALFERVAAVFAQLESGKLDVDDETERLIRRQHRDFLRAGADLDPVGKERLVEIDSRLAELSTEFSENLLASTRELAVPVSDEAELAGLDERTKDALRSAAEEDGLDGWLIPLGLPTVQPITLAMADAGLRRRVGEASLRRGATAENDNSPVLLEIVRLRAERAELLGVGSHADHVLAIETAGSADAARSLLTDLVDAAATNARHEAKNLTDGSGDDLDPVDWAYLAEQYRAENFDVDDARVRPYFELDTVLREGVFRVAEGMYGLRLSEREDLRGYADDVRVFEVHDTETNSAADPGAPIPGEGIGLLLLDYYARPTKRGGAWMTSFQVQSRLLETKPIVVNVMNLARPPAGRPTLLSLDEVTTMYHEFGHALHGLLSDVRYPTFSGTAVPRDFVEFPSQVHEMWARRDEILEHCARHVETGERIPAEVVERIRQSEKFGEGQATVEYLAAALIDLAWHSLTRAEADAVDDVDEFEAKALEEAGLDVPGVLPRYRSRYFQHIFAGGYSAAYYSYLWAEVLDADASEWLAERGGLDREAGDLLRTEVLSRGGAIDFLDAYRAMRGSEPSPEALLRRRGLTGAAVGSLRTGESA